MVIYFIVVVLFMFCIKGCGGGGLISMVNISLVLDDSIFEEIMLLFIDNSVEIGFISLSEVILSVDGSGMLDNIYECIEVVFVEGSIEVLDFFEGDYIDILYIVEDIDDIVGDYFVFLVY